MSKQAVAGNTSARDTRYWVKAIIGLALIFGIQFIPAPAPITQPGMAVIGMFVGLIWMIAAVDKVWPTFAVICLFSFYAFDIYPDSTASSPVYETVIQSFGNWIVLFIVKIKPKSDYPLKTLYPRAFQTGQNHLIYYDFTTVE